MNTKDIVQSVKNTETNSTNNGSSQDKRAIALKYVPELEHIKAINEQYPLVENQNWLNYKTSRALNAKLYSLKEKLKGTEFEEEVIECHRMSNFGINRLENVTLVTRTMKEVTGEDRKAFQDRIKQYIINERNAGGEIKLLPAPERNETTS